MADRFGWIGPARQGVTLQALERELAAWSAAWAVGDASVTAQWAAPGAGCGWLAEGLAAVLCASAEALGHALVDDADGAPEGLARHIGNEAMQDLLRRLGRDAAVSAIQADGALPRSLSELRLGALAAVVELRGAQLAVLLGRSVIDRLAPARKAGRRELTERKVACLDAAVPMAATLDLGEMPLAELTALRPGDVLVTRRALDTAVQLRTHGAETMPVIHARLGAHDGRRALQIVSS